jgi:hypothetical protein
MRRGPVLVPLVVVALALAGAAVGAGPSPGIVLGSPGVVSHDGVLRYVALRAGKGTLVESIATRGGAVRHARYLAGRFGVPLVAYDGSTGGLARSGNRLVLYAPGSGARQSQTSFVVLDPRTLRVQKRFTLNGNFGFDALSPDGSLLYLIQLKGQGTDYNVRALNVDSGRLYPGSIVDRREPDEKMVGIPVTRVGSGDGSWAYTLYVRPEKSPFVHALHTTKREAFCIDLPLRVAPDALDHARLRRAGAKLLLRAAGETLATIDTRTMKVTRQ